MTQSRIYNSDAQRQAAYRTRQKSQREAQAQLAMLGRNLHAIIQTAVVYSVFPLPAELAAAKPDATLRNLIRFFDPIYDPVTNPNGKVQRRSEFFTMEDTKTGTPKRK
jgi:hypothetical protein